MTDAPHTLPPGHLAVNIARTDLVFRTLFFEAGSPIGREVLAAGEIGPVEEVVLLQWLPNGDFEEIRSDERIQVTDGERPYLIYSQSDRLYRLSVNGQSVLWPEAAISEAQLRQIGRIAEGDKLVLRHKDGADRTLKAGEAIELAAAGSEAVYSVPGDVAAVWRLNVQGVPIESDTPKIGVREALLKAGFDPDKDWIIVLRDADGKRQLGIDDEIDLSKDGIERLRLTPREINNGDNALVPGVEPAFALLPSDDEGFRRRGFAPRRVVESGRRWLIFDVYPLPKGLSPQAVAIALEIPPSYPRAEIDMFYCHPEVRRDDGRAIPQTEARETIEGRSYQRWSRHRGAQSRWDARADTVLTHLTLVDGALAVESRV